ncbi:MAG: hypothetical protein KDB03_17030 [Planctomycetales bacterium]|nr:hypothetical protein [Planctomycetales bacterium]
MGSHIWNRKMLVALFVLLAAALTLFVIVPRAIVPEPDTNSYLIYEGQVSRAIFSDKQLRSRRAGLPRLPHHVTFETGGGSVDVYIVHHAGEDPEGSVSRMLEMTEDLKNGIAPTEFVAHGQGIKGTLLLNSWPYGKSQYLALIHAQQSTEVTLTVHYGP